MTVGHSAPLWSTLCMISPLQAERDGLQLLHGSDRRRRVSSHPPPGRSVEAFASGHPLLHSYAGRHGGQNPAWDAQPLSCWDHRGHWEPLTVSTLKHAPGWFRPIPPDVYLSKPIEMYTCKFSDILEIPGSKSRLKTSLTSFELFPLFPSGLYFIILYFKFKFIMSNMDRIMFLPKSMFVVLWRSQKVLLAY